MTSTTWAALTGGKVLFARSPLDLGVGRWAALTAVLGWDFIHYWNHRLGHESRWLWAVHSVHHSSERYNLSTALCASRSRAGRRTPGADRAGARHQPDYQFWIHTEAIQRLGWVEKVFNTPSHHRVHHGSNRDYLDRNHGSILILWDRLFGTFEEKDEPVVYGLTANIDTYNPLRIATHEWRDIAADAATADTWHDRWSSLLRRPGWAYARRTAVGIA